MTKLIISLIIATLPLLAGPRATAEAHQPTVQLFVLTEETPQGEQVVAFGIVSEDSPVIIIETEAPMETEPELLVATATTGTATYTEPAPINDQHATLKVEPGFIACEFSSTEERKRQPAFGQWGLPLHKESDGGWSV